MIQLRITMVSVAVFLLCFTAETHLVEPRVYEGGKLGIRVVCDRNGMRITRLFQDQPNLQVDDNITHINGASLQA